MTRNESVATEEQMQTIFVGLRDVVLDYSNTTLISGSNPNKGIPHTAERKALISAALKGIKRSDEFKQKVSATLMGHEVSDDAKEKMSNAAKNRPKMSCVCCRKEIQGVNNLNLHYRFNHA